MSLFSVMKLGSSPICGQKNNKAIIVSYVNLF